MKYSFLVLAGLLLLLTRLQGQDFVWAQQIGGAATDEALAVAVDSSGNVYTVGGFAGVADVDPGPGVVNFTALAPRDILVSKLDSAGNFVWGRQMGGVEGSEGTGIAVDDSGNVYTTGLFLGTADFDPGAGVSNLTAAGGFDIFVSKLDSAGNFVWAQRLGGFDDDGGVGVALDGSGNIYIVGLVDGEIDVDPAGSFYEIEELDDSDLFIARLDTAGNLLWSRQMSATGDFAGLAVAVDGSGNVYTTGVFHGVADFDPGAGVSNMTAAGDVEIEEIFISKLNSTGNFVWVRQMGGMAGGRWFRSGVRRQRQCLHDR